MKKTVTIIIVALALVATLAGVAYAAAGTTDPAPPVSRPCEHPIGPAKKGSLLASVP